MEDAAAMGAEVAGVVDATDASAAEGEFVGSDCASEEAGGDASAASCSRCAYRVMIREFA